MLPGGRGKERTVGKAAAGVAGGRGGAPGSFLPEDYLQRKEEARANFVNLLLFLVVLFGVVGAFFVTNRQWNNVRTQQAEINGLYAAEAEKIQQLQQLEAQKAEMLEKAEVTTALIERVPRSILLAEVINRMPEKLTLTELNMVGKRIREDPPKKPGAKPKSLAASTKGGAAKKPAAGKAGPKEEEVARARPPRMEFTVSLIGLSASDEDVADFHASLKECPLLDRVDLVSSVASKIDDVVMRKFRIEAMIKPGADARSIEPLQVPRLRAPTALTGGGEGGAGRPARPAGVAGGPSDDPNTWDSTRR